MSYAQLNGFLFTVACSPELIKPSEWLPVIFHDEDANYASLKEAETIMQALMFLYNDLNLQVTSNNPVFPAQCLPRQPAIENLADDAPLAQWARGFFLGHNWLADLWDRYTPEELDQELGSSMMVLSFFADKELANAYRKENTRKVAPSVEEMSVTVYEMLDHAMASYASIGWAIYQALSEANHAPHVRETPKTGRNDPCPCGSGKKYKKCCLH